MYTNTSHPLDTIDSRTGHAHHLHIASSTKQQLENPEPQQQTHHQLLTSQQPLPPTGAATAVQQQGCCQHLHIASNTKKQQQHTTKPQQQTHDMGSNLCL
jgi:hypothetical protein